MIEFTKSSLTDLGKERGVEIGGTVRHPRRGSPRIRGVLTNAQNAPPAQGGAWKGMGEAWSYLSTIVSGVAVWGAVGYGLDRWLGTRPVLFVIGVLIGNFAGIYLVYIRAFPSSAENAPPHVGEGT